MQGESWGQGAQNPAGERPQNPPLRGEAGHLIASQAPCPPPSLLCPLGMAYSSGQRMSTGKDSASLPCVCTCTWGELGDVEYGDASWGRGTPTATSEHPFPSMFTQTTKMQSF